tara:strand:+ start:359 stop:535 length:177 start_codon:yes stop_codon:yes gene_type:complete
MNKRTANKLKKEKQQEKARQRKLEKQILHYIRSKRTTEAGLLMERYKKRYGSIDKIKN